MNVTLISLFPWLADISISPLVVIIVLLFVGELLLGLDFFVMPGIGPGDILGFSAIIGAAVIAGKHYGFAWGVMVFILGSLIAFAVLMLGMRTKLVKKRFVLSAVQSRGSGSRTTNLSHLKGKNGIAITALRPAGTAQIDGARVDVVSEGNYIATGTEVSVILVEGARVVVRKIKE